MNKTTLTLLGGLIGLVLFFSVNVFANAGLRSMRADLTEDKLYTLSEGSRQIAAKIDEPIRLTFYSSEDVAKKISAVQYHETRVRELLEEFVNASDGKLILEVIDPEPFSEEEDKAVADGIQGIPVDANTTLFLGLSATNAIGDQEKIPFFDPSKERFLEYDVAQLIYSLANTDKRVVGVLSSLPLSGGAPNPMQPTPSQGWQVLTQIETLSETQILDASLTEVPEEVDVLMVVHPKGLTDSALYAIDQFVLGGGRALVFVDPHCDADQSGADPRDPTSTMGQSKASDLGPLFAAWGLEMVPDKFVGDRGNALQVDVGTQMRPRRVDFVGFHQLDGEGLNEDDPITSLLERLRLGIPGALRPLEGATTTFEPLIQSSEDAMLMDVTSVQYVPDPELMLSNFAPDMERFTIAARVSGEVQSAYPAGSPATLTDETSTEENAEDPASAAHRSASDGPINVVVVADCDLLADRFWVQKTQFGGMVLLNKQADNGDLVSNAVENLSGGDELISIRAHGAYQRPFDKVEELRRDAETAYLQEKQELELKQQQIQSQISEIIRGADPTSDIILTEEQEEELRAKQEEEQEIRRKLRDVEYNLRKDIEGLGARVKWINILAVPAIVALAAVALGSFRLKRRSEKRSAS